MNLKITKEEHDRLCSSNYKEYVFGSQLHGNNEKKRFHAYRSLYMADLLMSNIQPTVQSIITLKKSKLPSLDDLKILEKSLRERLNNSDIERYPVIETEDKLLTKFYGLNN